MTAPATTLPGRADWPTRPSPDDAVPPPAPKRSASDRLADSATTVAVALVAVLAAAPWTRAFPVLDVGPPVVVTIGLTVMISRVVPTLLPRRSALWSWPIHAVTILVILFAAVLRSAPSWSTLSGAVTNGLARLLSTTLPITTVRELLVVPVLVTWITTVVTAELTARTRSRVTAVVVAWIGFAVAYGVTSGTGDSMVVPAALLVATSGLVLSIGHWSEIPRPTRPEDGDAVVENRDEWIRSRPLRIGAAAAGALTLVAAVVVPRLPTFDGAPYQPERATPVVSDVLDSPVAGVAALRDGSGGLAREDRLFTVDAAPERGYVTLAMVDRYDGGTWRATRRYEPTGGRIPADPAITGGTASTRTFELDRLTSSAMATWLPQVTRATRVDGIDVRYDPESGLFAPATDLVPGTRYTVLADEATARLRDLAGDESATFGSPAAPDYTSFPTELEPELDRWLNRLAQELDLPKAATPEFFSAVADHLAERYARIDGVRGTSFAEVAAGIGGARAGTPEQFATLYALLARRLGVPSRVVTGARLPERSPSEPAGLSEVRAGDAWTWVELPVLDHGWVVVDPTPETTIAPPEERASAGTTTTTQPPPRPDTADIPGGDTGIPVAAPGDLTIPETVVEDGPSVVLVAALTVGGVVAALAVAAGLLALSRLQRRRRRRQGPSRDQVIGAWHQLLDTVHRHRLLAPADFAGATVTEVLAAATSPPPIDPSAPSIEPAAPVEPSAFEETLAGYAATAAAEAAAARSGAPSAPDPDAGAAAVLRHHVNEALHRSAEPDASAASASWDAVGTLITGIRRRRGLRPRLRAWMRRGPRLR